MAYFRNCWEENDMKKEKNQYFMYGTVVSYQSYST